jgi:ubiquinone/menaquinone biosynthesis C-methylase UbiE
MYLVWSDNPAQVMQEMCRVCKPGGMVYVFNHFKSQKEKQPLLAMLEKPSPRVQSWLDSTQTFRMSYCKQNTHLCSL